MPTYKTPAILPDQFTSFGELLKFLRRRAGLSQRELSIGVGYSESQISRLERNERAPDTAAVAARFVEALDLAREQEWLNRLLELAAKSRAEREVEEQQSQPRTRLHNLPTPLTSFVGREAELERIVERLNHPECRLLTLTGAGGIGKTRLALQVATEVSDNETMPDGVWWVELVSLTNPDLAPHSVATALGLSEMPHESQTETLENYLRTKDLILILDNCEHLISKAAQLCERLLTFCPHLKILATSREALAIGAEQVWLVHPLALPSSEQTSAVLTLVEFEAIRLFAERAQAVKPEFALTATNAPAVLRVCQRLGGIPLAIELAAARVKVLSVEQIAARLEDRFDVLTTGSRTALPRHQTLRAAIDWSYELLSPPEKILFRRLSVFVGGWTLEAAESVCAGEEIEAEHVLDLLSRLIDKSMVNLQEQRGAARYHFLETIRQYARDKLLEAGEAEGVQNRHLEYFVRLAEEAESLWRLAEQEFWFKRIELEHDNLRAALAWSQPAQGNLEAGLRLAAALAFFWEVRGYPQEGREHLMAALGQTPAYPTEVRAKALNGAGYLAYKQGDYRSARALMDESLAMYRDLGPTSRRALASTLDLRGYIESEVGEYATASGLIQQGLDIMRELKDEDGIASALRDLGGCALRAGDDARAQQYLEEALPILERSGGWRSRAVVLSGLAEIALRQANYDRASELEQQSLLLRREIGDKWGMAVSLGNLAWAFLKRGDTEQTVVLLQESVTLRREIGDPGGIAWCLEKLAQVALLRAQSKSGRRRLENFQRAARLLGAAAAMRAPSGSVVDLIDRAEYERQLSHLRDALDEATFAKMWAQGQEMTLGQAIEYAFPQSEPTPPVILSV